MLRTKIYGPFHEIFRELKKRDSDGFKGYVRIDVHHFEELIHLLSQFLQKHLSVNLIRKMEKTEKYVSENLLRVRGHVCFLRFSH